MGVSIQQWRASIGQWSEGRPRKNVATANSIPKKPQDIHTWFRFLVLASLLVIGCVELNPGPNNVQETSAMGQHGDTHHIFRRRPGTSSQHGENYMIKFASLLFAKGLNKAKEFRLASNMDGAAGVFDDLVFRYSLKEQDIQKTCFIQLKHKSSDNSVQRISLKQLSGDFSLFKYFVSYCEIKKNVSTDPNLELCGPFDDFEFVIYTNAKLDSTSIVKLDDTNPLSILVSSTDSGRCTTFDENDDKDIFSFFQELSEIFQNSISSTEISGKLDRLKPQPTKRVVEQSVKELQKCDFSWYKDFLQKVKIFHSQSSEKSLETLIKDQLREYCQTSSSGTNSIYHMFHKNLLEWWEKKGDTEWLSMHSSVWKEVEESLIKEIKLKAKPELEEIQGYGILFGQQSIKPLSDFLQDRSFVNIVTNSNIGSVSKLKIYQALDSVRNENPLFFSLKSFVEQREKILKICPCKWNTVLVIDCTRASEPVYEDVTSILQDYLQKPCKKLIIMSQSACQEFVSHLQQELGQAYQSEEYVDDCSFLDLDDNSQEQILKRTVNFQGTEVALKEVIGHDPHENIKRNIDSRVINLLLDTKRKLNIGKKLGNFSGDYVPRFLEHQIYLKEDILRTTDNTITFAINGLKANQLKNYLHPRQKICEFKTDNSEDSGCFKVIPDSTTSGFSAELGNEKKRHNTWEASKPEDVRYIILGGKDPENDFRVLKGMCTQVHWVERKNGSFLWRDSNCSIGIIRSYIDNEERESYSLEHMMQHRDNVLLLAAAPGMGKSTFLTSMEHEMKRSNPSMWVLRLNLHEYTRALEDTDFETESFEKCKNFLWDAAHSPEQDSLKLVKLIFQQALEQEGNMILMLDGFDEISPDYSCKVEKLMGVVKDKIKSKVWVSSRSSYRVKLEDILGRFAFTLRPFTLEDQISFLEQYWRTEIQGPERDSLRDFAKELLRLSSKNFSNEDGRFTGIPLHTMMLGEAFTNEAKEYYSSTEFSLPQNFNLLALFQKFTEKKFDIYFGDKNSMDPSTTKAKKDRRICVNKHKISALTSLFSSNELELLLGAGNASDLKNTVESGDAGQCGIITEFVDGNPKFIHRCFAEYFAGKWFSENFARHKNLTSKYLFNPTYEVFHNIFDRILAEGLNLHGAVLNNDVEAVNEMLKKETDVNCEDKGGRTALHLAASYNLAITQIIASATGADINKKDRVLNWTPLRYADRTRSWMAMDVLLQNGGSAADIVLTSEKINDTDWGQAALWECAEKGHKKLLEFMLNSGTEVNSVVRFGASLLERITLLHIASLYGKVEVVRFLLEKGADSNIRSLTYNTALHFATRKNCVDVVSLLLDREASDNVPRIRGYTPLHLSVISGSLEITKILFKKSDTNERGYILFMLAAEHDRLEIIRFLIKNGRDINLCVAITCALHAAVTGGHLDVIRFLLKKGADINGGNFLRGPTPLQIATLNQNFPVVKYLIEKGADVNLLSRDAIGQSALQFAIDRWNLDIVNCLVQAGADLKFLTKKLASFVLKTDHFNRTELANHFIERSANMKASDSEATPFLILAVRNNELELTKRLLQSGANINCRTNKNITALSVAVNVGNVQIVKVLLENNADINVQDYLGNTPLHVAVAKCNLTLACYLMLRGADSNIRNNNGHTPLDWIVDLGWKNLSKYLLYARWSNPVPPLSMDRILPTYRKQELNK